MDGIGERPEDGARCLIESPVNLRSRVEFYLFLLLRSFAVQVNPFILTGGGHKVALSLTIAFVRGS